MNDQSLSSAAEHRPEWRILPLSCPGVFKLHLKRTDLFLRKIVSVVSVLLVSRRFEALDGDSHEIVLHLRTDLLHLYTCETVIVGDSVFFEGVFAEWNVDVFLVALKEETAFWLVISRFAESYLYIKGLADDSLPGFKWLQFASEEMFLKASNQHFIEEGNAVEALNKLIL